MLFRLLYSYSIYLCLDIGGNLGPGCPEDVYTNILLLFVVSIYKKQIKKKITIFLGGGLKRLQEKTYTNFIELEPQ